MVPGNFHISFHHYVDEFRYLNMRGIYKPDFSHRVNKLEFGFLDEKIKKRIIRDFNLNTIHTLNGESNMNLMSSLGFPHSISHKLNIVPSRF